jgi:ATP-dependent DNA helicase DinG
VIDEAHQLEDVVSATSGVELGGGRFNALAHAARSVIADDALAVGLDDAGERLTAALSAHEGRRLRRPEPDIVEAVVRGRERVAAALAAARAVPADAPESVRARTLRLVRAATTLTDDLDAVLDVPPDDVAWVESRGSRPVLRVAPVEVAGLLRDRLFARVTAVLTSATLPPGTAERLGLPAEDVTVLDVGSPFDFAHQSLLYCAAHLPDPRSATFEEAAHDELATLVEAAGGRTLALFTSRRAMQAAVDALRPRLATPVLAQDDRPRRALVEAFAADEETSLFATMGFWQGVDVPGPSLSLVTVDRLPFPRPDEPLLQARRERARADAFRLVDLPRAITLLAQGVGRLVRSRTDRGVVAVLDRRLATSTRYRWDIVRALPPMRRTRDRDEVVAFLRALRNHPTDRPAGAAGDQ